MTERYAVLAEFATPEALLDAARSIRQQGYPIETFSPFPIEGLDEILAFKGRRVPLAFLLGGIFGALAAFFMQAGVNWLFPLWIGGRPLIAWPGFMLICFEMMVLCSVGAGILTMLLANRLPKLHHPLFDAERFNMGIERFFLAILAGPGFDRDEAGKALAELEPVSITDVPEQAA
jgi:hypothetical protein